MSTSKYNLPWPDLNGLISNVPFLGWRMKEFVWDDELWEQFLLYGLDNEKTYKQMQQYGRSALVKRTKF